MYNISDCVFRSDLLEFSKCAFMYNWYKINKCLKLNDGNYILLYIHDLFTSANQENNNIIKNSNSTKPFRQC